MKGVVPSHLSWIDDEAGAAAGNLPGDAAARRVTASFGPFQFRSGERLLLQGGEPVPLGGRALDLLNLLVRRAGHVVSRGDLISAAWPEVTVEESSLRVHISLLRKALHEGDGGVRYIMNVVGRGYCFVAPVELSAEAPTDLKPNPSWGAISRLPSQIPKVFGRDSVIGSITAALLAQRFVSIVGAGGLGKTTVAVAVAHGLETRFADGIRFIDLSQVKDADLVAATVASEVGSLGNADDALLGLVAFLADMRICLILDNCEHVIEAVAELARQIIEGAPLVHLLTTSREALRVPGEHIHLLQPLDTPREGAALSAAEALRSSAVQLFMERATASGHCDELDDEGAATVAAICQRLDGVALAIEIAAGRSGAYGIKGTAHLLDSSLLLSWQGQRLASPRQHSLRAMHDWSYNLLSPLEKRVLRRVSIFAGTFALDMAHATAADPAEQEWKIADAVASLCAKSLISIVTQMPTRYRLLETTRAFASGLLEDSGEQDDIARKHAQCQLAMLGGRCINSGDGLDSLGEAHFRSQIGDVRKALEWTYSAKGDTALGFDLAARAAHNFVDASLLQECRHWCQRALAHADKAESVVGRLALLRSLAIASMYTLGNTSEVLASIDEGLSTAEDAGDLGYTLHFLAGKSLFLTRRGDQSGALQNALRAASVTQQCEPAVVARVEWMLGSAHHMMGDHAAARRHCELGCALDSSPSPGQLNYFGYDHQIRGRVALARTYWLLGFPEKALKTLLQVLDEIDRCRDPITACTTLCFATYVLIWTGEFDLLERVFDRILSITRTYSMDTYASVAKCIQGEALILSANLERGISLLEKNLPILMSQSNHHLYSFFARALAEGLAKLERYPEAASMAALAVARAREFGGSFDLPDAMRIQAQILILGAAPDKAKAELILADSVTIAKRQSALAWELRSVMSLARLWAGDERRAGAVKMVNSVYQQFTEGHSTPDLLMARQLLSELA